MHNGDIIGYTSAYILVHLLDSTYYSEVTCCCCCWAVLLAATCADAMARACCRREEVAWRLATVMAALLGRIGGGPYSQCIRVCDNIKSECTSCVTIQCSRVIGVSKVIMQNRK